MKAALLLVCFVCAASLTFAQGLYSVHSPNGVDVWAVGRSGNIFHSYDGGVTWASDGQGTYHLRGVFSFGSSVWIVGDNGTCLTSTNSGVNWTTQQIGGANALRAVTFMSATTGWVVGQTGIIFKTINGGAAWVQQASAASQQLNAVVFVDSLVGYAGGDNGTLLKTTNGGTSWTNVSDRAWTRNLTSVAAKGQKVYVTGIDAFCAKSVDGGTSWTPLNFNTDCKSDVNDVFLKTEDNAFFIGGGGYVRESTNGGASFRWAVHPLQASVGDIFFYDNLRGWVCTDKFNVVMRTTDGGVTWQLPQGTTTNASWSLKLSASGAIGNGTMSSPWDKNKIYVAMGRLIYMSADRGGTWIQTSQISPSTVTGSTHSFYISPKDTNLYVAAFTGGGTDHIRRSTDRGITWTTTISRAFSAFGMPLEMDGSHPDTLYFAPEDGHLYRSTDFASTWNDLGAKGFTSPCDFAVVRDSANILWCGDSGPSRISRSADGRKTWALIYNGGSSEVPTIANSSLQNSVGYATTWSAGGVQKTTNFGTTWSQTATTGSAWGVDIAKDDPNVVMFGVYGGGLSYLSTNAGSTFSTAGLSGANYAILAYDRSTFIAEQSGGVYKLSITYTVPTSNQQAVGLIAPNGGENWQYNTSHNITWTASNFSNVKIEYKTSPAAQWQTIAASVPSTSGSYAWTIPNSPTTQARVRISDALDGNPSDTSDGVFSITASSFSSIPTSLAFGSVGIGRTKVDTLRITNSGTAPLVVSSAITNTPNFLAGRTSFTIPAGSSDTLTVKFKPTAVQNYPDTLRLGTNSPSGVVPIPLSGNGILVASVTVVAPNGGEVWNVGSTQNVRWSATLLDQVAIQYRILPTPNWRQVAFNIPAASGSYAWTIPNTPADQAIVRVVSTSDGTIVDESDNPFRIQSTTSVTERGAIPRVYELAQNYPNPFNPSTQISYGLPKESHVRLAVYNSLGEEVAQLVNEMQPAGEYTVEFSTHAVARELSSGIYYYRLSAGDFVLTKKFILLK